MMPRRVLTLSMLPTLLVLTATACSSVGSQQTLEQPPPTLQSAAPSRPPISPPAPAPQPSGTAAIDLHKEPLTPTAQRVGPTADKVVVLPEGVQLSDIRIVGRDLVINLPNRTKMVIPDGAVSSSRLIISNVEFDSRRLAALLSDAEPHPASGGLRPARNVSTRLFVPARFADFERYGAVAMIAFPQTPVSDLESNRYRRICEAYITILPDALVTAQQDRSLRQMITIWPRTDISKPLSVYVPTPAAAMAACGPAVDNYGYPSATAWLARVPQHARLKRMRRGPFLVAWAPTSAIGKPNSSLLIFDLSDFEDEAGIQRAFRIWKAEIENDPMLWGKGWSIARWKAHTAARLDNYGKQVTAAFSLVPWLKS